MEPLVQVGLESAQRILNPTCLSVKVSYPVALLVKAHPNCTLLEPEARERQIVDILE